MKVIVSVALWGRSYAEAFVGYSLATQLSPNNIPRLVAEHELTYHVVTTRRDAEWMRRQANFQKLLVYCDVVWDIIEDLGFLLSQIPAGMDNDKYPFLSRLQNIAFERSLDHDILVFNYADFIWADGALPHTIQLMRADVDAVLGFCPPVDCEKGKRALDRLRPGADGSGILALAPSDAVGIVVDNLHAEAALRVWDGPQFSSIPTYIIWPVGNEGLLVRAYHQTVLAVRVRPDDPLYRGGIRRGSLDGYFTAELAERGGVVFAKDSEQILAFSLYETTICTGLGAGEAREDAVKQCLRASVSEGQRRFAEVPLLFKRKFADAAQWESVGRRSWEILSKLHDEVPADWNVFLNEHSVTGDIESLEQRWRTAPSLRSRIYRFMSRFARKRKLEDGLVRPLLKRILGPGRARTLRLRVESWVFRDRTSM